MAAVQDKDTFIYIYIYLIMEKFSVRRFSEGRFPASLLHNRPKQSCNFMQARFNITITLNFNLKLVSIDKLLSRSPSGCRIAPSFSCGSLSCSVRYSCSVLFLTYIYIMPFLLETYIHTVKICSRNSLQSHF